MDKREEMENPGILIIGAGTENTTPITRALEGNPLWKIMIANSFKEAEEILKNDSVKVVLSDDILPDGTGLDILKIKQTDCSLIIMTSNGNEKSAVRSLKMGADNYLVKDTGFYDNLSDIIDETLTRNKEEAIRIELMKEAQEETRRLAQFNAELRKLDKIKSEFVSIASHELRTPLTIIREFVSLTKDGVGGTVSGKQKEYLQTALDNCDRLSELVDNLLDLEKIESGNINIRRKKCDISEVVLHCYRDFKFRAKSKKQSIEVLNKAENTFVICDEFRIRQVLINLLENAHKYSYEGDNIRIVIEQKGSNIRVDVIDNGPGIQQRAVNDVFRAFIQVQIENKERSSGSGLGLAIAKDIVELHDGNIDVITAPGKGCDFFFTIPLYTEEKEMAAFIKDVTSVKKNECKLSILKLSRADDSIQFDELEIIRKLNNLILESTKGEMVETMIIESEMLLMIIHPEKMDIKPRISDLAEGILEDGISVLFKSIAGGRDGVTLGELNREARHMKLIYPERISGKVLVVDDDSQILNVIKKGLEFSDMDLEVITATKGYDACIMCGNLQPDLVILDIIIPGEDMRQILRRIRESSYTGRTRIMVISGYYGEIQKMMEIGADDFLTKPFDISVFIEKVKVLLREEYSEQDTGQSEINN